MMHTDDEPLPKRIITLPRRIQWQESPLLLRPNVFKTEPTDDQLRGLMFSNTYVSLGVSLRKQPHLVGSSVVLPTSAEFGVYHGIQTYAAMFQFPSTPQLDLCGFELILVPTVMHIKDTWIHFLLPVADINGSDFAVLLPPVEQVADLMMAAPDVNLAFFATLALRYAMRLPLLNEHVARKGAKLAWKPKCKFELSDMVFGQVAYNDIVDWQVAFAAKLVDEPVHNLRAAIIEGTVLLCGGESAAPASSQEDLFATQTQTLIPATPDCQEELNACRQELETVQKKLQNSVRQLDQLQKKLLAKEESLTQQKEQLLNMSAEKDQIQTQLNEKASALHSVQQVLARKKEDFEAIMLKEIRGKHKDVGYYINFTLKHMFIDLEDEVANWQDRYDALVRMRDESVEWLRLEMQHRYNIVLKEDGLPEFKTELEQKVLNETLKLTADWDLARLQQEYADLRVHLFDKETDVSMYKDLYQFSLRAKEERFALQLAAARSQVRDGGTHKAWAGLLGMFRKLHEAAQRQADKPKALVIGSLMFHLMHTAMDLAKNETLEADNITEALLLGSGRDRIDLEVLKIQDDVHFESPCRELFATLCETVFDPRMTFVPPDANGVTLLDQALLAVAGQPMASAMDETVFFMKNSMGFASDFAFKA